MTKTFETDYGTITVKNVMIPMNINDLVEGIELSGDRIETIEITGYHDIEEMVETDVESLIEDEYFKFI